MIHYFHRDIKDISLPDRFTYPFNYTPHPLCVIAADEVKKYLLSLPAYPKDVCEGKMFGVLIVKNHEGETGYIAAYSGVVSDAQLKSFFVPPVYDLLSPSSFFKEEEKKINEINIQIEILEKDEHYALMKNALSELKTNNAVLIEKEKSRMKELKDERNKKRQDKTLSDYENTSLIKESQYQKAELKRLIKKLNDSESQLINEISELEDRIKALKEKRKKDSEKLQRRIFSEFKFLNANGEEQDLWSIFSSTPSKTPPAGAGECAAPKLLQYAYLNNLHPIAMGEFWLGKSPQNEIRHEGLFYPSCLGKCKPILTHMLQGLSVDEDPAKSKKTMHNIEILFEDEFLMVINKPHGMLSVPGKGDNESVESIIKSMHPEMNGPIIVHRLDMATSGLMIISKNKDIHKILQQEFINREVKKRYIALLDGRISKEDGFIRLPLSADYYDRPRQRVDYEHGKAAVTRFKIVGKTEIEGKTYTKIELYPLTGRTHQLRVHCAHKDGLNSPILGDGLYGKRSNRLYLHAERIEFRHPMSNKMIYFETKEDF